MDKAQFWWNVGAWKGSDEEARSERVRAGLVEPVSGPEGRFNPACKHERCSYDILTCEACILYTKGGTNDVHEIEK